MKKSFIYVERVGGNMNILNVPKEKNTIKMLSTIIVISLFLLSFLLSCGCVKKTDYGSLQLVCIDAEQSSGGDGNFSFDEDIVRVIQKSGKPLDWSLIWGKVYTDYEHNPNIGVSFSKMFNIDIFSILTSNYTYGTNDNYNEVIFRISEDYNFTLNQNDIVRIELIKSTKTIWVFEGIKVL